MSASEGLFSRQKKIFDFVNSRPGYTCKNVPGTYKCVPQNCTFGEKFNAFYGRCEKILCQPGFNVTAFGKCVGKMTD